MTVSCTVCHNPFFHQSIILESNLLAASCSAAFIINKNVEPQLLKRFLCHNILTLLNPPELISSELMPLLIKLNPREVGFCL